MARREVAAEDMTNEFITVKVKYRGVLYVITELSAAAYNKTVKQATKEDEDTKIETFDNDAHTRLLLARCVKVNGKAIDVEDDIYAKGNRLVRALQKKVLDLHLGEEPEEDVEAEDDAGEVTAEASA